MISVARAVRFERSSVLVMLVGWLRRTAFFLRFRGGLVRGCDCSVDHWGTTAHPHRTDFLRLLSSSVDRLLLYTTHRPDPPEVLAFDTQIATHRGSKSAAALAIQILTPNPNPQQVTTLIYQCNSPAFHLPLQNNIQKRHAKRDLPSALLHRCLWIETPRSSGRFQSSCAASHSFRCGRAIPRLDFELD